MAAADDFKGQLLGALDAPESNAKHRQLYELMDRFANMRRQKESQALTQIGRDCVATLFESFTSAELNAITRRWIGLVLHQVVEGCPATVHILTQDNHDLSLLGSMILTQSEDIKLVAGMIIKAMMAANVPVLRLWPQDSRAGQLARGFPMTHSQKWIEEFADFADALTEAKMLSQTTASMHYAIYVVSDGQNLLTQDAGAVFVLIEGDRLLLIRPASTNRVIRYLEFPVSQVVNSMVKRSQLRTVAGDDARQMVDELVLELDNGAWTYLLDAKERYAKTITVAFSDNEEAVHAQTHIEELRRTGSQKSSQGRSGHVKMSSSQTIDISRPPRTNSKSQESRPLVAQSLISRESQAGPVNKEQQINPKQTQEVQAVNGSKDTYRPLKHSVSISVIEQGHGMRNEEDTSNNNDLYDVSPKVRTSQQPVRDEPQVEPSHSTNDDSNPRVLVRNSQEDGSEAETEIIPGRQKSRITTKPPSTEAASQNTDKQPNSLRNDRAVIGPAQQNQVTTKSQSVKGGSSAALALARKHRGKENIPPHTTEHNDDSHPNDDTTQPAIRNQDDVHGDADQIAAKHQKSMDSRRMKGTKNSITVPKAANGSTKSSTEPKDRPDKEAGKLKPVKTNPVKDDPRLYELPAGSDEDDNSSVSDYAPPTKKQRQVKAPARKSEPAKKSQPTKKPSGVEKARKSTGRKSTQGRSKGHAGSVQPKAQPKLLSSLKQKSKTQPVSAEPQASQMTVKESLARKRQLGSIAPSQKPDDGDVDEPASKRPRVVNEAGMTAFENALVEEWQRADDGAIQNIDEIIAPGPRSDVSIAHFEAAVLDMPEETLPTDLHSRLPSDQVLPTIEREKNHQHATETTTAPAASQRPDVGGAKAMSRLSLALGDGDSPRKSEQTNDNKKRKVPEERAVVDENLARKPTLINFGPKGPLNQGASSVRNVRKASHNVDLADDVAVSEDPVATSGEIKPAQLPNEKAISTDVGNLDIPEAFRSRLRKSRLIGEADDDNGLPPTQAASFSDDVPVAPVKQFPSSGPILPKPIDISSAAPVDRRQDSVPQEEAPMYPSRRDYAFPRNSSMPALQKMPTAPAVGKRFPSMKISDEGSPVLEVAEGLAQLQDGSATDQSDVEDSTLLPPHSTPAQYASQSTPQRISPSQAPRDNVLSSNSKLKPSSPTADSRAITGHKTQEQIERTLSSAQKPDDPFTDAPTSVLAKTKVTPLTAIMRRHFKPDVEIKTQTAAQSVKEPALKHGVGSDDPDRTLVEEEEEPAALPPKKRKNKPKQQVVEISSADDSDSSSEATAAEIEAEVNNEHNEQMEWEASLAPHQKSVLDVLLQISRRLVRHLISHEAAISDMVEDYLKGGQILIADLENAYKQQNDAGREVLEQMRTKHAKTFRSIGQTLHDEKESRRKQGEKIRLALREMARENRRGVEGVKAMLAGLEKV